MQQGRSTIKAAAAAATSYVCLKNHSGKPTAMEIKDQSGSIAGVEYEL